MINYRTYPLFEDVSTDDWFRFCSHINYPASDDEDACWEINLKPNKHGYTRFRIGDKKYASHRLMAVWHHNENPKLDASHLCNNRRCVKGEHLIFETRKENDDRKNETGTRFIPTGIKNGSAKLNPDIVKEIRTYDNNYENQKLLAEKYTVTTTLIRSIMNYKIWKHVI